MKTKQHMLNETVDECMPYKIYCFCFRISCFFIFQGLSELIQWVLHAVETWCDELGLSVNPDKTGLVAFTRRKKLPGFFEPRLFGTTLRCSTSVKCLGIILDSRQSWREHMDVKVRKAHNLLWDCRRAYGVTWCLRLRVV